jgi:tRNA(Ile)-lysidine synthase
MKVEVKPGKYVLALSGGVDSMTLLDLLSNLDGVELVVAHFNHGIRLGSADDEGFVREHAGKLDLPLEIGYGELEAGASEEQARVARYDFLEDIRLKHEAKAIITAHHQDDLIETAIINILRGTGPQGLVAITSNPRILRPMLAISKKQIVEYAQKNSLSWVEDESNDELVYLRNYVRAKVVAGMSQKDRQEILRAVQRIDTASKESNEIFKAISGHIFIDSDTLDRLAFIFLPDTVARELLARWLRGKRIPADRKTISRLSVALKTARPNSEHEIAKGFTLELDAVSAHLSNRLQSA